MRKSVNEILLEQGIDLKFTALGNHRAICPKCVHTRRKQKEKCLSVKITQEGVQWHCFINKCDYSGGEYFESSFTKSDRLSGNTKNRAGNSDAFRRVQRQNWHKWGRNSRSTV